MQEKTVAENVDSISHFFHEALLTSYECFPLIAYGGMLNM